MIIRNFFLLFYNFFTSEFFLDSLIYLIALSIIPICIFTLWRIIRGYVSDV